MVKRALSLYLAGWLIAAGMYPVSAGAQAQGKEGKRFVMAVLNLDAKGVSQVESEVLSERLRSHILQLVRDPRYASTQNRDQYEIVEQTQMDKILDQFNIQNTGCVSDSCAVEFGKMLAADRILIGQVGLVGKTYSVSARIVDVESRRTLRSTDRQLRGSIDEVMNTVIVEVGNELVMGKAKKSKLKWYLLTGAVLAGAGAGAAMSGGGGGDGGGGEQPTPLPFPPSRP